MKNIFSQFTLRTLHQNKVRTLVTIIGIALSVAMFTAVTSIIVSFQQYMIDRETEDVGAWEGWMEYSDFDSASSLQKDSGVKKSTMAADLGYALAEGCVNEAKPYLFVMGIEDDFTDLVAVNMLVGRMPENAAELVISEHVLSNGEVDYQVGDQIDLELGQRVYGDGDSAVLEGQSVPFQEGERLTNTCKKTYTIVGICERMRIEGYAAPGYTALTRGDGEEAFAYDIWAEFRHPKQAAVIIEKYLQHGDYTTHSALLRYQGNSLNSNFNSMLYSMGAILMCVIIIGSVSLIYNSFSISVSERTKQFGLLKSIGATNKQIRHSVFFEVCYLSLFGIPLGIMAGLGGIGITLHFLGGLLDRTLFGLGKRITLHVTWWSVLSAAAISLVTVLISSMIPARRAMKRSAMESIRQSADVRIRPREVRTSRLAYRLFGFEVMIANKNFKRNRKKYRTTVFSLFISIVLFVTAGSFTDYLKRTVDLERDRARYDVSMIIPNDTVPVLNGKEDAAERKKKEALLHDPQRMAEALRDMDHVSEVGFSKMESTLMEVPLKYLSREHLAVVRKMYPEMIDDENSSFKMEAALHFVEDKTYENYLKTCKGLQGSAEEYMNPEQPVCLVWDTTQNTIEKKYYVTKVFQKMGWEGEVDILRLGVEQGVVSWGNGEIVVGEYNDEGESEEYTYSVEEVCVPLKVKMGDSRDDTLPLGVEYFSSGYEINLLLPYSYGEKLGLWKDEKKTQATFMIRTDDHTGVCQMLGGHLPDVMDGMDIQDRYIYDKADEYERQHALMLIVEVFSYGFIALLSLISIANVFNTISTNIQLRRQEFAMLKSVGMTEKGFRRMMNYECILYGLKGLLTGIPGSMVVSWLMYRALQEEWNANLIIPWKGIGISAVCVFLVVFATMLYSMSKLKKENIIEALRNENL